MKLLVEGFVVLISILLAFYLEGWRHDQELDQKVAQNMMSGVQQRTANLMQNLNPYDSLYPGNVDNPMDPMGVPLVPGPDGQLINENLMKLTGGDRDELERRRQILGGM